jgi:hypothetical protein
MDLIMLHVARPFAGGLDGARLDSVVDILTIWIESANRLRAHQQLAMTAASGNITDASRKIKNSRSFEEWCEHRIALGLVQLENSLDYWNDVYALLSRNSFDVAERFQARVLEGSHAIRYALENAQHARKPIRVALESNVKAARFSLTAAQTHPQTENHAGQNK